jgi:ATP phosphoribosyltransferase
MGPAAWRTDEWKVEIGVLKLGVIGEDLVHEQRDRLVVVVPGDRVT